MLFMLFIFIIIYARKERGAQSRPAVVHRLYVEPERWLNGVNVFAIELFDDCRLARVVQAPAYHRPPPLTSSQPLVRESTPAHFLPWMDALDRGGQGVECRQTSAHGSWRCSSKRVCVREMAGHIHHQDTHLALHLADFLQDRQQAHASSSAFNELAGSTYPRTPFNYGEEDKGGSAEERFVDAIIGFEHG
jgi:hypothetical protein